MRATICNALRTRGAVGGRASSTRAVDVAALSDRELAATRSAILQEQKRRRSTLIIGAAGAVGTRLCAALSAAGHRVIASDRMGELPRALAGSLGDDGVCVGNVDVTDGDAVMALFREHADANTSVWNLAAPLSVETAMNPEVAEAVTIGGMENVLAAMAEVGARRICFTDSIGSFGADAPRTGATARWLTENPTQDPGSDYGRQKRGCRELMKTFAKDHGGDPRFAVLPGVLHSESVWGNGTTEYALDALLAAPHQASRLGLPVGDAYVCPVDPDVRMPMVFVDDLMRGLIALQEADEETLVEPEHGYCLPGLSFSANELFAEIRKHYPGFGFRVELDENMAKFAKLWPDALADEEPLRDLGYKPDVGLEEMVASVLAAHEGRNLCGIPPLVLGYPRILQKSLPPSNRTRFPRFLDRSYSLPEFSTIRERAPKNSFRNTQVEGILNMLGFHTGRNDSAATDWKAMDRVGDGYVRRVDIEKHINQFLAGGRESYGDGAQYSVIAIVDKFLAEFNDTDGRISWQKFSEWNRKNTFADFVRKNADAAE